MTTKRFLGQAAAIYDLWTISLSGTVVSQTYSFTMNGKTISYAASGSDTVATILAALVSVWNQTYPANPPEFQELLAVGLPVAGPFTSMTLTQNNPGIPSAITVATGGAATFSITNTTPGTGPSDFTNAQNWSGGVAPVNSDTLVVDNGSTPILYNLSTSLTGITLLVSPAYSGQIGLPFLNSSGGSTYAEYRATSMTFVGGTVTINSAQISRCNLAFGSTAATVRILNTGQRVDPYTPVVLITGGASGSALDITKGDVATAWYVGTTANFPTILTSYVASPLSDVVLWCGAGSTLTTVTKSGGTVTLDANAVTVTQNVAGGVLNLLDAITVTTLNVYGGTCNYSTTGTVGTIVLDNQAILNANGDPRAKTVTNAIQIQNGGISILDDAKSINSGTLTLTLNGNKGITVQHGAETGRVYT